MEISAHSLSNFKARILFSPLRGLKCSIKNFPGRFEDGQKCDWFISSGYWLGLKASYSTYETYVNSSGANTDHERIIRPQNLSMRIVSEVYFYWTSHVRICVSAYSLGRFGSDFPSISIYRWPSKAAGWSGWHYRGGILVTWQGLSQARNWHFMLPITTLLNLN